MLTDQHSVKPCGTFHLPRALPAGKMLTQSRLNSPGPEGGRSAAHGACLRRDSLAQADAASPVPPAGVTWPPRLGPVGRAAAARVGPPRRSRQPPLRRAASKGRWAAALVRGGSGLRITCSSGGAAELRLPLLPRLIASHSPVAGTGSAAAGQSCHPAAGSRAPAPRSQRGPGWGCRLRRPRPCPSPVQRGREAPAASPRGATAAARPGTGSSAREKKREGQPWPRGARARTRSSSCEL